MADERYVDTPPGGFDGWREVWESDRRYRPRGDSSLWSFLRRLFRRATEPDAERQKNFNVALLDLLADARRDAEAIRRDLRRDIESVQGDMRGADAPIAAHLARRPQLIPASPPPTASL